MPHFFLLPSVPASFSPSAYQAGILSAASRAEMADVEQMKKIVPSSLATLAPLPALLGVQFCVVPSQLGSTGHHGVPQHSARP